MEPAESSTWVGGLLRTMRNFRSIPLSPIWRSCSTNLVAMAEINEYVCRHRTPAVLPGARRSLTKLIKLSADVRPRIFSSAPRPRPTYPNLNLKGHCPGKGWFSRFGHLPTDGETRVNPWGLNPYRVPRWTSTKPPSSLRNTTRFQTRSRRRPGSSSTSKHTSRNSTTMTPIHQPQALLFLMSHEVLR